MVFNFNKKKIDKPELTVDDIYKIFGKKRESSTRSKARIKPNPLQNESLNSESEVM